MFAPISHPYNMKTALAAIILVLSSYNGNSQKVIDTTTLSNGKTIVVYSNNTWKYVSQSATASTEANVPTYQSFKSSESSTPAKTKTTSSTYKAESYSSSSSSHQCHGTTKKGARCSRMVASGYNCYQHGG